MSAPMPEVVWVELGGKPNSTKYWVLSNPTTGTPYVPESRLLAAEARVREVEKGRDALYLVLDLDEKEIAREIAALSAERDALVPLAWWGLQEALGFVPEITPPTDAQITQARAILAREAGE